MTTIAQARSDLTKMLLVACDQSYRGGLQANPPSADTIGPGDTLSYYLDSVGEGADVFPNTMPQAWGSLGFNEWTVFARYDESTTGFGATVYQKAKPEGSFDYIVAMQGTRGPNLQDWSGNLIYGWDKWGSESAVEAARLLNDLLRLPNVNNIHFTGQSLGGALAQYALYDYAAALKERHADDSSQPDFDASKVTLTTFNGLGGIEALSKNRESFDPTFVGQVDTAHFFIANDLAHRLGEGHLNGISNGSINTYVLNFSKTGELSGLPERRTDLSPIALDFVSAHRVESGFYAGFNKAPGVGDPSWPADFSGAKEQGIDYLRIAGLAQTGTYVAWLTNQDGALPSNAEAVARATAALTYALGFGNQAEIKILSDAFLDNLYASDAISKPVQALLKATAPKFLSSLAASPSGLAANLAGQFLALAVESQGTSTLVDVPVEFDDRLMKLVIGAGATVSPAIDPGQVADSVNSRLATAQGSAKSAALYVGAAALSAVATAFALPSVAISTRNAISSAVLDLAVSYANDAAAFTRRFLEETALALRQSLDDGSDAFAKTLSEFAKSLGSSAVDVSRSATVFVFDARDFVDGIKTSIAEGLTGVAKSLSNAYSELTLKFTDTFEWGVPVAWQALDAAISFFVAEARAEIGGAGRSFDKAIDALESAAQVVVIRPGREANPFDDASFNPDTAAPATGQVKDGAVGTYLLFLPYEAGEGGQRIQIQLSGVGSDKLTVLSDGAVVPVTNGAFILTIAQGRKQVGFSLEAASDLEASGTVSIGATLVDVEGVPTHQTHLEANLSLVHEDETFTAVFDAATATDFPSADKISGYFSRAGEQNDPTLSRTELVGTAGGDLVIGDHASESIEAGGGKDFIIETAGSGTGTYTSADAIDAGSFDDLISGYLGARVDAGDGNDFVNPNTIIRLQASRLETSGAVQLPELPPEIYSDLANFIRVRSLYEGPLFNELIGSLDFVYVADFGDDNVGSPASGISAKMGAVSVNGGTQIQRTATGGARFEFTTSAGIANIKYLGATTALAYGVAFESSGDIHNTQGVQIDGGSGNDLLYGAGGEDFIQGGAGNDRIAGFAGDDTLEGEDGDDLIIAGAGDDYVDAGSGNDKLWGEGGNDGLWGGLGNDLLYGDADATPLALQGDDYLDGGAGDDQLFGNGGNDELFGGDGFDVLDGADGSDYLDGEAGNDTLRGGAGDDKLIGGEGDDDIAGADGNDYLDAEIGNDRLDGGAGNDTLFSGDGNDALLGGAGDDVLDGEAGSDQLSGADGNDTLYGGRDNDRLQGGAGNDTLIGGSGDSILLGDAGDDTYVLDLWNGLSIIDDQLGANRIVFADGIFADDVVAHRTDPALGTQDLVLTYGAGSRTWIRGGEAVQSFQFADGTSLSRDEFLQTSLLSGYERRSNILIGTPSNDILADTSGADVVAYALDGNDTVTTAAGNDMLIGGVGNDTLASGAGNDYLEGGAGFDTLQGGAGGDSYVYDTLDVVIDSEGLNRIVFGAGLAPENLRMSSLVVSGQSRLLIAHPGEAGPGLEIRGATLTTPNFIYAFADGRTLSQADLVQASYYVTQNLYRGAGDDTLLGFAGNDSLFGGDGNDTLFGNAGNDALAGYNGDDALYGGAGDDNLSGGEGNDLLHGGPGKDFLNGGPGSDTYFFGYGDGQDTVSDDGIDSAVDSVRLADGVSAADVSITHDASGDLVVTLNGTQDKLVLQGWYTSPNSRVERIEFGDGAALGEAELAELAIPPITGTSENDVLTGTPFGDTLEGLTGDDTLYGGLGDDVLAGGEGSDRYVLGWGAGKDAVIEQVDETSTVLLANAMQFDDLVATQNDNDLFLHTRGTEDGLLLKNYYTQSHEWQLQAADGQVQALADFLARPTATTGNAVLDLWEAQKKAYKAEFYIIGPSGEILSDGRLYFHDEEARSTDFYRYYYNGDITSGSGGLPDINTLETYRVLQFDTVINSDAASQYWNSNYTSNLTQTAATYSVAWDEPQLTSTTSYAGTYVGFDLVIRPLYLTQTSGSFSGDVEAVTLNVSQGASALELFTAAVSGDPLPSVVNGTFFTQNEVFHVFEVYAGASSNLIGFRAKGFVDAGAGNDIIDSSGGGRWNGESSGNVLYGNTGNDGIIGSGNDDLIIGGPGADRLAGWSGDDTFYFFADELGVDVVNEATWFLWDTAGGSYLYNADSGRESADTVEFGPGIKPEGLTLSWGTIQSPYNARSVLRTYDTLDILWGAEKGVRVMMPDRTDRDVLFDMDWSPSASWGIEYFKFADGTVFTMDEMANRVPVTVLNGTSEDDYLYGTYGRDLLVGGAGSDYLEGDAGDDSYRFNAGDGEDWVDDRQGTDTVVFGAGITPEMLTLGLGSLRIQVGSTGDVLHVERFDPSNALGSATIETYQFNNGVTLTHAQLLERGFDIPGTDGSENLPGTNVDDRILGFSGDDALIGGAGDDTLDGGTGKDILRGGHGSDVYAFGIGFGVDALEEADPEGGDTDALALGAGITPENLHFSRLAQDLVLTIDGAADTLTVRRWYDAPSYQIEEIRFTGGPTWDAATIAALVPPPNKAPVLASPIADQTANEDAPFEFTVPAQSFSDPDLGEALLYSARLANGSPLPAWLSFNASTRSFSGIPTNSNVGTLSVRVTATDPSEVSVSDVFDLTVLNTNDAPTLAGPIADQNAKQGQAFSFTVSANAFIDVDVGDTLTYSANLADGSALPSWLTFDASTRILSGTPASTDVGGSDIRITATDGSFATASDVFRLTVAGNTAPMLFFFRIPDVNATEDAAFNFPLPPFTFFDPDGDPLTYSASLEDGSPLPAWLSFNAATKAFSGTPGNSDVGIASVKITVTDPSSASAFDVFNLTVVNTNDALVVANAVADQEAGIGQAFNFTVPATAFLDIDPGDSLTYGATLADGSALPGWLAFEASTRTFSGTPSNGDAGSIDVRVTGTDRSGASAYDVFSLTVSKANNPPFLANPIPDQSAIEDAIFSLTVAASTFVDPDAGDTLAYTANLVDGSAFPGWLNFDASTRTFSGTPENSDVGTISVRVAAADTSGESVSDAFELAVVNTNDAPTVVSAIADQSATEDAAFSFTMAADTFADVDVGDTLVYSASLADHSALPSWLVFNADTLTFSGTPANEDVGTFAAKVTAADTTGESASDVFALTVINTNDAPVLANDLADEAATEDELFIFTVPGDMFSEVDAGDVLTYGATSADGSALPSWISFDAATLTFSGTPANENVGTARLTLLATDTAGASASDSFEISVANVNDAPVVARDLADQSVEAGGSFAFTVPGDTFIDIDAGDTLTLSAAAAGGSDLPAWLSFDPATATFSGSPRVSDITVSGIVVTAVDGSGASTFSDFALIVSTAAGSSVSGGSGEDILFGSTGDETLSGGLGDDALFGGIGNDLMRGGGGDDVLQGGGDDDVLRAGTGNNLLDGGTGDDVIFDGAGNSFIAGGAGNDTIRLSAGEDVISFNLGDGWDTIYGGGDGGNTLSFGGGIRYSDLSLSKSGSDLILKAGDDDGIVLKDWYGGTHSLLNLQLIQDATEEFDAASSDPLRNRRVQTFDFLGMVSAFDHARMSSPGLTSWQVTNALLEYHLWGADDMALGGDLAYWYGRNRSLAGFSLTAAQQVIGAPNFGSDAQALRAFSGLQEGFVKLS